MDPFTALSLAGNVIQFVDFASKLLDNARELHSSTSGFLAEHETLALATTDLRKIVERLKSSFPIPVEQQTARVPPHPSQDSLKSLCDKADYVADELATKLESLKINERNGNSRMKSKLHSIESIEKAFKSAWAQKDIKKLENTLKSIRSALDTNLLMSLRETINADSARSSARFDSLDRETQHIISSILNVQTNDNTRHGRELQDHVNALTTSVAVLLSRVGVAGEAERRKLVSHNIVQCLAPSTMCYRYEDIVEAHSKTFEWIFEDTSDEGVEWNNFSNWLTAGDPIYWINGKAGAGKSTLMKFIFDDRRTKELLRVWSGDSPLIFASYFFWNSGREEQRSQSGFLRGILSQILRYCPELVAEAFPEDWALQYTDSKPMDRPAWSIGKLKKALETLIKQKARLPKICFFVDGLDEFAGDHEEMAKIFRDITESGHIKACVTSRPWVVFEDLFGACSKLRVQDLTRMDIDRFVTDRFHENDAFQALALEEPDEARSLMHEIGEKADGVFVWVKIVVRSLLTGMRNRDELSDLWHRLRLFPKDLGPLYDRILELVEPIYFQWAARAFLIFQATQNLNIKNFPKLVRYDINDLSVAKFYLAMNQQVNPRTLSDHNNLRKKCENTIIQITARCGGLLEVSSRNGRAQDISKCQIRYYHRTTRDYLESESTRRKLCMQTTESGYNPYHSLMRACISALQIQPIYVAEGSLCLAGHTLLYANHAQADAVGHQIQLDLLNQLQGVMSSSVHPGWMQELSIHHKIHDFLSLATGYGLEPYLAHWLPRKPDPAGTASSLLVSLIPRSINVNDLMVSEMPYPSTAIVTMLLDHGADPNVAAFSHWLECNSTLLQIMFLNTFHCLDRSTDHVVPSSDLDVSDNSRMIRKNLEVMTILVESGADFSLPRFTSWAIRGIHDFKVTNKIGFNVFNVISRMFLPIFPREASCLIAALQRASNPATKHAKDTQVKRARAEWNERRDESSSKRRVIITID